ncbi:hypothetical protein glysoja_018518 [Glycine soja]|nr:hypothetical protein glysoja_018518 [Glycine soja]
MLLSLFFSSNVFHYTGKKKNTNTVIILNPNRNVRSHECYYPLEESRNARASQHL